MCSYWCRRVLSQGKAKVITLIALVILASFAVADFLPVPTAPLANSGRRFVVVVFDDMRFDDTKYLPQLASLATTKGQMLDHAFIACPMCCPSRASLLTGLLASNHKVLSNKDKLALPTIFPTLRNSGIRTGLVGKYLNSHGGKPLPEFDYWVSFRGGSVSNWMRPRININGRFRTTSTYISDIVLEQSEIFTQRYSSDPYVLYMNFTAPHRPALTPPEFPKTCADISLPSEFNLVDSSAPKRYQKLDELKGDKILRYMCDRATTLRYLDAKLTDFIGRLVDQGVTVFVVSDNGVMLGENRMREKGYPYPEVVRTPFLVFNYRRIDPNRVISLVDIPATILQAFQLSSSSGSIDGVPLNEPRTSATIEHFGSPQRLPFTATAIPGLIQVTYQDGLKQEISY